MSASGQVESAAVEKPVTAGPATEQKPKEKKKAKKDQKEKKKPKTASHPPYFEMIKEALLALKEKGGSSPHAIGKYMEEKHKEVLPANFKKILGLQLKNSASKGKLIKVKASYKLSDSGKKATVTPPKAARAAKKAAPAAKPKAKVTTKKTVDAKRKAEEPAKKEEAKVAKAVKKTGKKKAKKVTPAKAKQPKSIKSPTKKAKKAAA